MYDTIKLKQGKLVGMGITAPRHGNVDAIVKSEDIPNEYISVELAHLLGVPVPPGFIAKDEAGRWCFVSVRVGIFEPGGYSGESAVVEINPVTHPNAFVQARRIDAFDYLIGNTDRHPGNALWTGPDSIAAIDHGFALTSTRFRGQAGRLSGWGNESHKACLAIIHGWINHSLLEAARAIFDCTLELFHDSRMEYNITALMRRNFLERVEVIKCQS